MCIVGRNQTDNDKLESLAESRDILLRLIDHVGPIGLLLPAADLQKDLNLAATAVIAYSDAPLSLPVKIEWQYEGKKATLTLINTGKDRMKRYQI